MARGKKDNPTVILRSLLLREVGHWNSMGPSVLGSSALTGLHCPHWPQLPLCPHNTWLGSILGHLSLHLQLPITLPVPCGQLHRLRVTSVMSTPVLNTSTSPWGSSHLPERSPEAEHKTNLCRRLASLTPCPLRGQSLVLQL